MRNVIDRFFGLTSMYKGTAIGLSFVWTAALLFSFVGVLWFSPLALICSLIVLLATVYGTSLLFGLMFGVKVHADSSYITALILSLIFSPSFELQGLLVLGLVGVIAAASKFLLAFKGRHIFNPAALAAVAISVTGLGFASWWVATPPLVPFVLAIVLVGLSKTKRLSMAGVFLGIATPLVVAVLLMDGASVGEALMLLLSWPLLFFAGIMLTEPLTLPPRRWQQYLVAAIVALLFAIPIDVGIVEMTPALALLVGNLVAFTLAPRRRISLSFDGNSKLTPTTDELSFTTKRPIRYEPGQYMELSIPHHRSDLRGERRAFSMTSAPNSNKVTFGIKYYQPSSTYKTHLKTLKKGTIVEASIVGGDFVLPRDASKPILYVAGGVGITPFISHLQYLLLIKQERDIVLIYAVSSKEEVSYTRILEASGIRVVVVTKDDMSKEKLPEKWTYIQQPFVAEETIKSAVPDVATRYCYVSGPPALVNGVKTALRRLKVRSIKTDYFVGY